MAEDFVTTGGEEFDPEDAGRRAREAPGPTGTIGVHPWKNSAGKVWAAFTGARKVLYFGEAGWRTQYVYLDRARATIEFAMIALLLWKAWTIAHDLHIIMLRGT